MVGEVTIWWDRIGAARRNGNSFENVKYVTISKMYVTLEGPIATGMLHEMFEKDKVGSIAIHGDVEIILE